MEHCLIIMGKSFQSFGSTSEKDLSIEGSENDLSIEE